MSKSNSQSALFVTASVALKTEGGGVQRCTREYIEVMRAAGLILHILAYPFEHRLWVRVLRKFWKRPYRHAIPRGFADVVRRAAIAHNAEWILINQTEAAPLIPELVDLQAKGVRIALLSHGTDSCDYIHLARARTEFHQGRPISARDRRWLGGLIFEEQIHHRLSDVVFCLSETDRHLEQWLGGRKVIVLPRVIADRALQWTPLAGRVGTVGTLTHGPNYEGLVLFCRELAGHPENQLTLRLVGTPEELGRRLSEEFHFVEFLGGLSDAELALEAQTWCAFVNPLFCYPRGCSTKLAVPLEWRIPVCTTRAGARGYVWDEALIPLVDTPRELAELARRLAAPSEGKRQRAAVHALALKSPKPADVASLVRETLR